MWVLHISPLSLCLFITEQISRKVNISRGRATGHTRSDVSLQAGAASAGNPQ